MKEKSNEKENEKSSKEVLTEGDKFGILLKLSQDSRRSECLAEDNTMQNIELLKKHLKK